MITAPPSRPHPEPDDKGCAFIHPLTDLNQAVEVFRRVFRGRMDAYGLQQEDGSYITQKQSAITAEVLAEHLSGRITIGMYPIMPPLSTCFMTVIDVDQKSVPMAKALISSCRSYGLRDDEFLIEASGQKGFHIWVFFAEAQPAAFAMDVGRALAEKAGLCQDVEVFPKQRTVPEGGYGNLIKLPGFHAKARRFCKFLSADLRPLDFTALEHLHLLSNTRLRELDFASGSKLTGSETASSSPKTGHWKTPPCIEKILRGVDEGRRNICAFRLALHLKTCGLPAELAAASLRAWNSNNRPPMPEDEMLATLRRAFQPQYRGLSCDAADMHGFCDPGRCPIHAARARRQAGASLGHGGCVVPESQTQETASRGPKSI